MCPVWLSNWHDTTLFLLLSVFRSTYNPAEGLEAKHILRTFKELCSRFISLDSGRSAQRVCLLSQVKSHEVTHRKVKAFICFSEAGICLNNGSRWQYFDDIRDEFVVNLQSTDEISRLCTYSLLARSSSLQRFTFRTVAIANDRFYHAVIVSQLDCLEHMILDEYEAFGTPACSFPIQ